jgi:hypothetical protein
MKPPLQKILQGILHTENESKQKHERTGSIKLQEKKRQGTESNIDSAAHNQILKQQKQLNDRNHHISVNIDILTLNVSGLISPIKRHHLANY